MSDRGKAVNRARYLASQILSVRAQILELEKQARKTPPKTLVAEKQKVELAKRLLVSSHANLVQMAKEWQDVCAFLQEAPQIFDVRANAFLGWNAEKEIFEKK